VSTLVHQPKLDVAVNGPDREYINKTATYSVTVKNTGDAPARRTVLGLDAGDTGSVMTAAVGGEGGAADVQVASAYKKEGTDLGTLSPGEARTVTVTVRANKEGQLPVKATAVASCVAPISARAMTNILTLPALRLEVVDLDDPIRVGDAVVYRITVKNQGTGADHNVGVTATVPPELKFITAEGPTTAKAEGQTVRLGTLETLAAGDQAVWRVQCKAIKAGDVRMRVDLKSDALTTPAIETEPTRLY
ncbi:MAG TPA: CARDB domain-containing protein, partial [Tepidisphaeraceae bacterium]